MAAAAIQQAMLDMRRELDQVRAQLQGVSDENANLKRAHEAQISVAKFSSVSAKTEEHNLKRAVWF